MSKYHRAHRAVERARGKAKDHTCLVCGQPAYDWALKTELHIFGSRSYSDNVDDYEPLCRSCHRMRDVPQEERRKRGLFVADARRERLRAEGRLGYVKPKAPVPTEEQLEARRQKRQEWSASPEGKATLSRMGKKGGKARAARFVKDEEYQAQARATSRANGKKSGPTSGKKTSAMRRKCITCGLVTTPGGMGTHLSHLEHEGYEDV